MKKTVLLLIAVAGGIFASCTDNSELSQANKGKEKPSVSVSCVDSTLTEFYLNFQASEGSKYVAYAVYAGDAYTEPSAYEVLTKDVSGTIASNVYECGSEAFTDTVLCILKDDYHVYAAAMTGDGLIGEVTKYDVTIEGAHPAVTLKLGTYTITPSAEAVAQFDPTYEKYTAEPMSITLSQFSDTEFLASGYWFNLLSFDFVGTYDYSKNQLVFDGTVYWGEEYGTENDFGGAFWLSKSDGIIYALWGAGSEGYDPMIFQCKVAGEDAIPTSVVQGIDFEAYYYPSYEWISSLAYFEGGETITADAE